MTLNKTEEKELEILKEDLEQDIEQEALEELALFELGGGTNPNVGCEIPNN
ncbi:hypothetical protein [Pseudoalteromonas sp. R3]|uniref:hypothetical protein n=1 Tax=Pseudoalteromonas sp. R3 TaxID=1709477 RepID=UPI001364E004|nr:hypothetical protein [Pseudoalteromonas sp. R3]